VQQVTGQYMGALANVSWLVETMDSLLFGIDEYTELTSMAAEPDGEPVQNAKGDLVFDDTSFTYPQSSRLALKHVSLRIPAGQTVAIVGENGAGKTTLVKLLMKIYEPSAGTIAAGGQTLGGVNSSTWHQHIGVLFQDYYAFNDFTIRDTIWFGDITKDHGGKEVQAALRAADAESFVKELPHGVDTYLGKYMDEENGTYLSGGQLQRLAIARTLFRNPDILILDEPTSAIDAKAEYKIFQSIERARKGRTTILISHRFSTVRRADYIYVLSNGRLLEEGTHEALMARKGLYHEMFTKQAEGYL
jgi:ATP-binding cassette subfamily B protein